MLVCFGFYCVIVGCGVYVVEGNGGIWVLFFYLKEIGYKGVNFCEGFIL